MSIRTVELAIVVTFPLVLLVLLTVWAARLRRAQDQNAQLRQQTITRAEYEALVQEVRTLTATVRALEHERSV